MTALDFNLFERDGLGWTTAGTGVGSTHGYGNMGHGSTNGAVGRGGGMGGKDGPLSVANLR